MGNIALIAAIILTVILWAMLDHTAAKLGRSPQSEARRPHYKLRWQAVVFLLGTGVALGTYFYVSSTFSAIVVVSLFAAYAVFRRFLSRSPAVQRCFLATPLPTHARTPKQRDT